MFKKTLIFILLICAVVMLYSVCVNAGGTDSGDKTATVLCSDIVAYVNGFPIQTCNINGRIAATANDLMAHGFEPCGI